MSARALPLLSLLNYAEPRDSADAMVGWTPWLSICQGEAKK